MMDDRAMFKDMQGCLRWAFYGIADAANTVKGPVYAQWQSEDKREQVDEQNTVRSQNTDVGGVPRGLLAAGQAGAIKRHVFEMPGDEGAHIMVKFLMGQERHEGHRVLRRLVADYIDAHGKDRYATGLLVSLHYRRHTTMTPTTIASKVGLDRRNVTRIHNKVRVTLDALSLRAENRLYNELQNRGLVK